MKMIDGASGTRLQIGQPITGNYGITKDGSGLLTLSNVNTYTGNTTVNAGTLTLANGASLLMNINDDDSTQLLGIGTINLNGRLDLDVSGFTDIRWKSWDLVDVASLTETYGATFEIGFNGGAAFTEGGGVWTYKDTSGRWRFSQATGTLDFIPNYQGTVIMVQ